MIGSLILDETLELRCGSIEAIVREILNLETVRCEVSGWAGKKLGGKCGSPTGYS
jgi:hypothetical protein